jgi:hydroxymethylglutaryl-CoA lyase
MVERAAEYVEIFEVGPRDGLQNEPRPIPTKEKIALVDCLSRAGFARIEVASFVSPKWVPQMADSGDVLAGITRQEGVRYAALTPNMRGLEGAMAARADEVAIFGSASEGFSKANINASIAESLERFAPVVVAAREAGLPVRGYVSCVSECPYDGPVDPGDVARVAAQLYEMGCYEISLGDTTGRATPDRITAMLTVVRDVVPVENSPGITTTRGAARWRISRRRWRWGCGCSMRPWAGLGAVPMRRGPSRQRGHGGGAGPA